LDYSSAHDTEKNRTQPSTFLIVLLITLMASLNVHSQTIFFQEHFEDTDFASRGWYDNNGLKLSTAEHVAGSKSSVEFHFYKGATTPTSGGAIRHAFPETEEVYVSYYVKYSENWEGSNRPYHPHEFLVLTNKNGVWTGPAYTRLTAYIEQNEGEPLLSIQDSENIDESNIGVDLTRVTENRALAGCNGDSDGHGEGDCYRVGSVHRNGKQWRAGSVYFRDDRGDYYKNDWHFIEAYFRLNSIVDGKGVADGVVSYWYDGRLIIHHDDVMLRTGQHPDMRFNQFLIAPWIGDGSPVDQTFWVDNLTVATSRVVTHVNADPYRDGATHAFSLLQNYPDPFTAVTRIRYTLSSATHVRLTVFDALGRRIRTLVNDRQSAGSHGVTFDAGGLPGGVYFYRLTTGTFQKVRRMILAR